MEGGSLDPVNKSDQTAQSDKNGEVISSRLVENVRKFETSGQRARSHYRYLRFKREMRRAVGSERH